MKTDSPTEADLDAVLAEALRENEKFAQWFLERTKFKNESAKCVFCRSDNPWSRVSYRRKDPENDELKVLVRDCETDVLAVYLATDGRRLALHIENKLARGSFTDLQPELYQERLSQWQSREKLGMYVQATSVLIAPREFHERNVAKAQVFEAFVAHEDIAEHLPAFASPKSAA